MISDLGSFFNASGLLILFSAFALKASSLPTSECGVLDNEDKTPWTVGVYIEQEPDRLELMCLGSVLKGNHVITAAQCVCQTLSKDIRKENIYISKKVEKVIAKDSNAIQIELQNVMKPKEYQGFLLNPLGDLAILKIDNKEGYLEHSVCVDWTDLTKFPQDQAAGFISVWDDNRVKTQDALVYDYDYCELSASENFIFMLSSDKNCFKIGGTNLDRLSVGSGIYYKNPKDGKWYIEGVVSGSEAVKNGVILAATSVRRYLAWLSRMGASY